MIPAGLQSGIDRLLEGVSRNDLARRAAAISGHYREGSASRHAIASREDGLAYLVTRLPATYAASQAALRAVKRAMPDFAPTNLLDAGAGPGTASWAAQDVWPEIDAFTLIDENPHLITLGQTLAKDALGKADWRQGSLLGTKLPTADLVIASYALGEARQAAEIVRSLWAATKGVLVLIEPGTPAGYGNIIAWRAELLALGATLAAPCPHDAPCPIVPPDWCHFSQRLTRSRDHRLVKIASLPFEDERFSYVAASRVPVPARPDGRVLMPPIVGRGAVICKICTNGRIDRLTAERRTGLAYKALSKKSWGDEI